MYTFSKILQNQWIRIFYVFDIKFGELCISLTFKHLMPNMCLNYTDLDDNNHTVTTFFELRGKLKYFT